MIMQTHLTPGAVPGQPNLLAITPSAPQSAASRPPASDNYELIHKAATEQVTSLQELAKVL